MVGLRRTAFALFAALSALAFAGCGGNPAQHPVRGSVTAGGKPAADAQIFLHRKGRTAIDEAVPYATADADGKFQIGTQAPGDGAPVGEYAITVVWPDMSKKADGNGQRPDLLRGTYEKPAVSKLTFTVEAKANEIPPIELTVPAPTKAGEGRESNAEKALRGNK